MKLTNESFSLFINLSGPYPLKSLFLEKDGVK